MLFQQIWELVPFLIIMHRIMEGIKPMKTNPPPMKALAAVVVDHKEAPILVEVTRKESDHQLDNPRIQKFINLRSKWSTQITSLAAAAKVVEDHKILDLHSKDNQTPPIVIMLLPILIILIICQACKNLKEHKG